MAIPKALIANLNTLVRAATQGDLAVLECTCAKTGEPVYTVTAVGGDGNGGIQLTPLARLFEGDPYKLLIPPNPEDCVA